MENVILAYQREMFPLLTRVVEDDALILQLTQEELLQLQREVKAQNKEWFDDKYDPTTGLLQKAFWYGRAHSEILKLVPELRSKHCFEDSVAVEAIVSRLCKVTCIAVSGDISHLNMVNDIGSHEQGDGLLEKVGRETRKFAGTDFIIGRPGGDEMCALAVRQTQDEVVQKLRDWQLAISNADVEILRQFGFKAHIDIGIAHLWEAITCVSLLAERKQVIHRPLKQVANTLMLIADYRSKFIKNFDRLGKLTRLWIDSPDVYRSLITYLRKGANNVTDEEIAMLADFLQSNPTEFEAVAARIAFNNQASTNDPVREYALEVYRK